MVESTGLGQVCPRPQRAESLMSRPHFRKEFNISFPSFAFGDSRQDLQHPFGADAAGNTLSAGFVLGEAQKETGNVHHAGLFVHDDHAARSHHGTRFGQDS